MLNSPWMQRELDPLVIEVPDLAGLATLKLNISDQNGNILHRNFVHFEILSDKTLPGVEVLSKSAGDLSGAEWSKKQWDVLEGKKLNGAGEGYFEYTIPISKETSSLGFKNAHFLVEVSAKELFVKDQQDYSSEQE